DIDNSVDVVKGNSYVGGLLGYVPSSIRIERTINTVNSIGPNTASAVSYAGGFAGLCGSSTSSCSAEMIKNRIGKIQGNTVGGMFGESPITIIRNTDSIIDDMQANSFAAGLIGYASRKIVFENINSTANITASSMYTGGLVGALQVFEIEAIVRQTSSTAVIRASSFSYLAGLFGYTDVFVTSNPGLMFHNVYTSAMLLNSSGSPVPNPRMYLNLNSSSSSWPFAASNAFWQRHGDNDVATPNSTYNGYFTEAGPLEKVRDDLTSAMSAGDRSWEITKTDLFDTINEVVTLKPLALEISFEPLDF
ncbi:MAG: hypothetical protein FWC40_08755, partial [Proteobacteria bacterium]|nr:hypothetical protein [Pseudomonadota bacterium]